MSWDQTGCDSGTHPAATQAAIDATCGTDVATTNHCVCMIAKSHSCYVGCRGHLGGNQAMKAQWTKCMADCYPSPTCPEMCAGGTDECETKCVASYTSTVEPFWTMFEGSDTAVPD